MVNRWRPWTPRTGWFSGGHCVLRGKKALTSRIVMLTFLPVVTFSSCLSNIRGSRQTWLKKIRSWKEVPRRGLRLTVTVTVLWWQMVMVSLLVFKPLPLPLPIILYCVGVIVVKRLKSLVVSTLPLLQLSHTVQRLIKFLQVINIPLTVRRRSWRRPAVKSSVVPVTVIIPLNGTFLRWCLMPQRSQRRWGQILVIITVNLRKKWVTLLSMIGLTLFQLVRKLR